MRDSKISSEIINVSIQRFVKMGYKHLSFLRHHCQSVRVFFYFFLTTTSSSCNYRCMDGCKEGLCKFSENKYEWGSRAVYNELYVYLVPRSPAGAAIPICCIYSPWHNVRSNVITPIKLTMVNLMQFPSTHQSLNALCAHFFVDW